MAENHMLPHKIAVGDIVLFTRERTIAQEQTFEICPAIVTSIPQQPKDPQAPKLSNAARSVVGLHVFFPGGGFHDPIGVEYDDYPGKQASVNKWSFQIE